MRDIKIFSTGGTIDKNHDPIAEALVFSGTSNVPEILEQCRVSGVPHEALMFKDSFDFNDQDRETILSAVQGAKESKLVFTHGTSTMQDTALFLKDKIEGKTVVLTGAMRPFSFHHSDAGFNIGGALIAAQCLPPGVYIAMNGRVFEAGKVNKNTEKGIFEEVL